MKGTSLGHWVKLVVVAGWVAGCGPSKVDQMIARLKSDDPKLRQSTCDELGKLGDLHAVPPLIAALQDENWQVRVNATEALGRLADKRALGPLIATLNDPQSFVRMSALRAVAALNDGQAVEPVVARLKDENSLVRLTAITMLGYLKDPRALEPLIHCLADKNGDVRNRAAESLALLGDTETRLGMQELKAAGDVPTLIGCLQFPDPTLRGLAADTLVSMGAAALQPLQDCLTNNNDTVRTAARDALAKLVKVVEAPLPPKPVEPPVVAAVPAAPPKNPAEYLTHKAALLSFTHGEYPTLLSDGADTVFTFEFCQELGSNRVMKVNYAPGECVGDREIKISDWTEFGRLEFAAYNPGARPAKLTFTIKHKQTTSYQSRIDVPFVVKPGANQIQIDVRKLRNNNKTEADLAHVGRWYIACEPNAKPSVWFGDIWLAEAAPEIPLPTLSIQDETSTTEGKLTRLERIRAAQMPAVTTPVMFNTPKADAIASALEIYPPDNAWNQTIADWPLHPNSANIVIAIGPAKPLRCNTDMAYIFVPPDQPRVAVKIVEYPAESDKGPYPVPDNTPIEEWPIIYLEDPKLQGLTLADVQRDKINRGGDRHAIIVDPLNRMLYEFWGMRRTDAGWQAAQGTIFDLKTNKLRPDGWTSSDAAGLPIFPAVVRYDELKRGRIEHPLRVTVRKSRRAYVAPATHFASSSNDANLPRMGERLRLRRDFNCSEFSPEARTVLTALQQYGMFVADNGIEWAVSIAADDRIPPIGDELRQVKGSDFEVVTAPQ